MNSERRMIPKEVHTLDLDGYLLKNVIKDLTELLEEYGDDVKVSQETYQYTDGTYLALIKPTPETDQEMEIRIKQEKRYQELTEQSERAVFERLQKKFGQ